MSKKVFMNYNIKLNELKNNFSLLCEKCDFCGYINIGDTDDRVILSGVKEEGNICNRCVQNLFTNEIQNIDRDEEKCCLCLEKISDECEDIRVCQVCVNCVHIYCSNQYRKSGGKLKCFLCRTGTMQKDDNCVFYDLSDQINEWELKDLIDQINEWFINRWKYFNN